MKRTTRLIALLCALVLLAALAGCGKNPTPTPDPTPTPEYEMIAVTMPEQQADVAGEKIIKADWAIYSLWMLTDEHNLYRCGYTEDGQPDITTLELQFQGVKDILVDRTTFGSLSVLFDDGSYNSYNVLEMGGPYQPDPIQEVAAISYDSILLKDGTVRYYRIDYAPEKMLMYGREAQSKTRIASPATIPKSGERNRKIHSCMLYLISI